MLSARCASGAGRVLRLAAPSGRSVVSLTRPPLPAVAPADDARADRPSRRQQVRTFAGRKDRSSTALETRRPTRKQLKKYNRRMKARERERTKHSPPHSKAIPRKKEMEVQNEALAEMALEEEGLKARLASHFDRVNELQAQIEGTPKFQEMLQSGMPPEDVASAAREAARRAAERTHPHPPLPSWWQERMTYDWGDALVDDLVGNSSDLTSAPSPYPINMGEELGRLRRKVERIVRGMEGERMQLEDGRDAAGGTGGGETSLRVADGRIPDRLLSDLIRAHRDAHGRRTAPVGLDSALGCLEGLKVPADSLGVYSYTSLLTCCRNPGEGREVDRMRVESGTASTGHYWSAMVDVYSRSGDYRGAESVLDEMLEVTREEHDGGGEGRPLPAPPLAAYTSFLSACHKLVSRGDVHPRIKSDAGERAWSRWKEMRIHSVPPDAMAYGALLRILAARGQPEKAIDVLEEVTSALMLPTNTEILPDGTEVETSDDGDGAGWYDDAEGRTVRTKPTTLMYTSALNAVAKSHEVACRFSGGLARKNRKRESITSYHGRLARQVVIMAEQAEVAQDDGFVAALMRCAAAAGDSSTVRAIYLASKVRRMDHLRTCGGRDHLLRLQGLIPEEDRALALGDGAPPTTALSTSVGSVPAITSVEEEHANNHAAYENREYGDDTRPLSTLLLAHAKAMEAGGLGNMWAGRINRGYLCPNSLRYIESFVKPQYENLAIPGLDSVKAGLTPEGWETDFSHDDPDSKRLRKSRKFTMQDISDDGYGNRRDELDSFFDGFDPDPDEEAARERRLMLGGGEEATRDWIEADERGLLSDGERRLIGLPTAGGESTGAAPPSFLEGGTADAEPDAGGGPPADLGGMSDEDALAQAFAEATGDTKLARELFGGDGDAEDGGDEDDDGDFDIDDEEFARLMGETLDDTTGGEAEEVANMPGVVEGDFELFNAHLREEAAGEGMDPDDVTEDEARQLFDMMRGYLSDSDSGVDAGGDFGPGSDESTLSSSFLADSREGLSGDAASFGELPPADAGRGPEPQLQASAQFPEMSQQKTMYADDYVEWMHSQAQGTEPSEESTALSDEDKVVAVDPPPTVDVPLPRQFASPLDLQEEDPNIVELRNALPGLPQHRIERVSREFQRVLGYPSIIRLALAVRENMPEQFSPQCLARVNLANAKVVMVRISSEFPICNNDRKNLSV